MKKIILLAALAFSSLLQADPIPTPALPNVAGQPVAPALAAKAAEEQAALLKLAREVQAQQATMAENQAKIDERLNAVAEGIRVARIYSSRSGN